ncbi:MAG: sporulation integral membrane protein YtvI [Eubacterium sp.]|nr:sporulation integral membrane protein YtvI [Eubacterium sp.]MDE6766952.1 sporulation integral membrane protein YtvI [Eubacterium sp.]
MTNSVKKRRDTIINVVYLALVIGLVYVFFKYCFSVAAPFLLSFFFAVLLQRPLRWLDKRTNNKCHTLWSLLLVLMCILILVGPVVLILSLIGREIGEFASYLSGQLSDLPNFLATLEKEILSLIKFLPDSIYTSASDYISDIFSKLINNFNLSEIGIDMKSITSSLTTGVSGIYGVVKNIPSALIGIVIGIVAWILFTKDYNYIVNFIKLQLPEGKKNILSEIKQIFSKTVLKMVRAYSLIMFITFCELFLGLSILNWIGAIQSGYVVIIAIAIAVFDILPVAGSGGILIPWALVSLVMGNVKGAIGLMVVYAIITVIRQYIEPKIVGSSLGVHPLVTLAGLYFGLKLFGFMGMFIVPLGVMTLKAFNDAGRIHLFKSPDRN